MFKTLFNRAEDGDKAAPLEAKTHNTESQNTSDIKRCLKALLIGDYSVTPQGDDVISDLLRQVIQKLSTDTQEEMSRVVNVSVQANETAIFSAHMLSNLRSVDQHAQGIAAAAEEMVATVQEIGSYGQSIADQADETQQATSQGAQATQQAVRGMDRITEVVNQTVEKVSALTGFSEQIGNISENIKGIADQTNLLALNATIEAARAGEAGRGFSVVASEVKALASQTRTSAEEATRIISDLQHETQSILQSMQDSKKAVSSGQESIGIVGSRMDEINTKINLVTQNTLQIANTLSEQKQASQEVAEGINKIAKSSAKSVKGIERIVDAMDAVERLISAQITKMAELNVPDKVIKLAQSDHVLWKKRLANMIAGREGLNPDELADHHSCRLGKWYDNVSDSKYKNNPIFKELVEPHRLVHKHGIQAVRYFNDKNLEAALKEIEHVENASKDVLRLLSELENK